MEIFVKEAEAYHFLPQVSLEVAKDRIEQKKTQLIAGTFGALLSRPKPEEFRLVALENRLEPFWLVTVSTCTRYDRTKTYSVAASGAEVQSVTIFENTLPVETKPKEGSRFVLPAVEHCLETARQTRTYHGLSGDAVDYARYLQYPKNLIPEIGAFTPEGVLVVPPQVTAAPVIRQTLAETLKPVGHAHTILEERVDVEALELNLMPIYALEYEWLGKNKRQVLEFNALSGEINASGKTMSSRIKGIISRDLVFDITADAVGMVVPGGSIAVKLVKAVVDRPKNAK